MQLWRYQAEWLNSYRNECDGILHDVDLSLSIMLGALADCWSECSSRHGYGRNDEGGAGTGEDCCDDVNEGLLRAEGCRQAIVIEITASQHTAKKVQRPADGLVALFIGGLHVALACYASRTERAARAASSRWKEQFILAQYGGIDAEPTNGDGHRLAPGKPL